MNPLEVAAAIRRELGIMIVASPGEPLPAGFLISAFYVGDPTALGRQPVRIVRPATEEEIERQRAFVAELLGQPFAPGGLRPQYVVESD